MCWRFAIARRVDAPTEPPSRRRAAKKKSRQPPCSEKNRRKTSPPDARLSTRSSDTGRLEQPPIKHCTNTSHAQEEGYIGNEPIRYRANAPIPLVRTNRTRIYI